MFLDCRGRRLALEPSAIMGIFNATPDSFSDGGDIADHRVLIERARAFVAAGCAIFDVGGESTRPGATAVSADEECARIVPVIELLANEFDLPISVDTSKAAVMRAAVDAGAGMINDVRALREEGALVTAAQLGVPICLMHMQGEPRTMQNNPQYGEDPVADVVEFLSERIDAARAAGIDKERIVVDPGFGFGKLLPHSVALFNQLDRIVDMGYPLLVGVSRKSMIGQLTGLETSARDIATATMSVLAAQQGAHIMRVHNVAASAQALSVYFALRDFQYTTAANA